MDIYEHMNYRFLNLQSSVMENESVKLFLPNMHLHYICVHALQNITVLQKCTCTYEM